MWDGGYGDSGGASNGKKDDDMELDFGNFFLPTGIADDSPPKTSNKQGGDSGFGGNRGGSGGGALDSISGSSFNVSLSPYESNFFDNISGDDPFGLGGSREDIQNPELAPNDTRSRKFAGGSDSQLERGASAVAVDMAESLLASPPRLSAKNDLSKGFGGLFDTNMGTNNNEMRPRKKLPPGLNKSPSMEQRRRIDQDRRRSNSHTGALDSSSDSRDIFGGTSSFTATPSNFSNAKSTFSVSSGTSLLGSDYGLLDGLTSSISSSFSSKPSSFLDHKEFAEPSFTSDNSTNVSSTKGSQERKEVKKKRNVDAPVFKPTSSTIRDDSHDRRWSQQSKKPSTSSFQGRSNKRKMFGPQSFQSREREFDEADRRDLDLQNQLKEQERLLQEQQAKLEYLIHLQQKQEEKQRNERKKESRERDVQQNKGKSSRKEHLTLAQKIRLGKQEAKRSSASKKDSTATDSTVTRRRKANSDDFIATRKTERHSNKFNKKGTPVHNFRDKPSKSQSVVDKSISRQQASTRTTKHVNSNANWEHTKSTTKTAQSIGNKTPTKAQNQLSPHVAVSKKIHTPRSNDKVVKATAEKKNKTPAEESKRPESTSVDVKRKTPSKKVSWGETEVTVVDDLPKKIHAETKSSERKHSSEDLKAVNSVKKQEKESSATKKRKAKETHLSSKVLTKADEADALSKIEKAKLEKEKEQKSFEDALNILNKFDFEKQANFVKDHLFLIEGMVRPILSVVAIILMQIWTLVAYSGHVISWIMPFVVFLLAVTCFVGLQATSGILYVHYKAMQGFFGEALVNFAYIFCFGYRYIFGNSILTGIAASFFSTIFWYSFIMQYIGIYGTEEVVMATRIFLPAFWVYDMTSPRTFYKDASVAELCLLAYILAVLRTRRPTNLILMMVFVFHVVCVVFFHDSILCQWMMAVMGLFALNISKEGEILQRKRSKQISNYSEPILMSKTWDYAGNKKHVTHVCDLSTPAPMKEITSMNEEELIEEIAKRLDQIEQRGVTSSEESSNNSSTIAHSEGDTMSNSSEN
eukprot:g2558.t1